MGRVGAVAICVAVLGGSMSGCRGPRVERMDLEVARTAGYVVFTSEELFERIVCSIYSPAQTGPPEIIPGNAPAGARAIRLIWRARCPHGNDCARSVAYGDARLHSDLAPMPLDISQPGECYLCSVSGDRRRGEVLFSVSADGLIVPCPDTVRRRK